VPLPIKDIVPTIPNTGRIGNLTSPGLDVSAIIGTVQFGIEASALESSGAISVMSRPFTVVLDGESAELDVGKQLPVAIQGGLNSGGELQIIQASNILAITPYVIDDDSGNPVGVNLALQIESNEVDRSLVVQGVPAINRRSIQTRLLLDQEKTVILGGFTLDSTTNDVSKTIGLGDIPLLGFLFKRKIKREELNRLYFAISVSVIPYGTVVQPVDVPNASTDIPAPKTKR
jgi:type IV pilus assembly protein PilQ